MVKEIIPREVICTERGYTKRNYLNVTIIRIIVAVDFIIIYIISQKPAQLKFVYITEIYNVSKYTFIQAGSVTCGFFDNLHPI